MIQKGLVSIIVPTRNEKFLQNTIDDLTEKSKGEVEIIAVLDGYWPNPPLRDNPRLTILHTGKPVGMRECINMAVSIAKGEYLMKTDAHCMFDKGFDKVLINDCEDNWVVIPRRLRLDAEKWEIQEESKHKIPIDYEYLSAPGHHDPWGNRWDARIKERLKNPKYEIDENMMFQGSCWFMSKKHFETAIKYLETENYGPLVREAQEIGLKTWLSGGKVMTNKKTWYAHLHKGTKYGRMYHIGKEDIDKGIKYCDDFWYNNKWTGAKYDLAWLIERFMPVPSWTPELIEKVRKRK